MHPAHEKMLLSSVSYDFSYSVCVYSMLFRARARPCVNERVVYSETVIITRHVFRSPANLEPGGYVLISRLFKKLTESDRIRLVVIDSKAIFKPNKSIALMALLSQIVKSKHLCIGGSDKYSTHKRWSRHNFMAIVFCISYAVPVLTILRMT